MRVIYKYEMSGDTIKVDIPLGGEILKLAMQRDRPCLWVLVDPNQQEKETRHFMFIGTGHDVPDIEHYDGEYVGTVIMAGESLVLHLFELSAERLKDIERP